MLAPPQDLYAGNNLDPSDIGAAWHHEAIEAWKIYNNGKILPETELKNFLSRGNSKDQERYYILACEQGCPQFCSLAGHHEKNAKIAAARFERGCNISRMDDDNCIMAWRTYLKLNEIVKAKTMFTAYCDADDMSCEMASAAFGNDQGFKEMITLACNEGHKKSCGILEKLNKKP